MKQLKKLLLMVTCVGVLMSVTACGSNKDDNGAVNSGTGTNQDATENVGNAYENDTNTNDATDGTTNNERNEGVMDEIGDDIRNGVDNVEDSLEGDNVNNANDNNVNTENNGKVTNSNNKTTAQ